MRLEYATPVPSEGPRQSLTRALALLCVMAGVPICAIGIAVAAVEINHPEPVSIGFIVVGAGFCFFGMTLQRHLKRRWVRGIYIPDAYIPSVCLLRTAFPRGIPLDSPEYTAICLFLDHEGCPPREIAHILVFSFDIEYADAINALEAMELDPDPKETIARMEQLLEPHDLQTWRTDRQDNPPSEL